MSTYKDTRTVERKKKGGEVRSSQKGTLVAKSYWNDEALVAWQGFADPEESEPDPYDDLRRFIIAPDFQGHDGDHDSG